MHVKSKIASDDRIIMAQQEILPLKFPVEQNNIARLKPSGLWYSIGTEWIDWVESEMPKWKGDHFYKLDVDMSKIRWLKTPDDIYELHDEYKESKYTSFSDMIFWNKVAEKYSGIEISPYQWSVRDELMWYYGWDVASGCIWNKNAIRKITKLK